MAKRDTLRLSQHQWVETYRDGCGRAFIAYSSGCSVFIREPRELRRFLKIPKSIPMRAALDSWLASLEDMDLSKKPPVVEGSAEPGAGSWDPLAHIGEDDPTANTRMVV